MTRLPYRSGWFWIGVVVVGVVVGVVRLFVK